jgi:hypothetical protein
VPSGSSSGASEVYLQAAASKQCLVVVPDNNNNTLGVALGVADASTGALVPGIPAAVDATDPSAGMTLSLSLKSGAEYAVVVGLQTLRDIGCAGVRDQWEGCSRAPEDAAAALVRDMATVAGRGAAVAESEVGAVSSTCARRAVCLFFLVRLVQVFDEQSVLFRDNPKKYKPMD